MAIDINQAYELGANSYLVKPAAADFEKMIRALEKYWLHDNQKPTI